MIIDQRTVSLKCCFLLQRADETYVYCTAASDEVDPFLCPEHREGVNKPQHFEYRDGLEARRLRCANRPRQRAKLYELLGHGRV